MIINALFLRLAYLPNKVFYMRNLFRTFFLFIFCFFIFFSNQAKAQKTAVEYIIEISELKKKIKKLEEKVTIAYYEGKNSQKMQESLTFYNTKLTNIQIEYSKIMDENDKIRRKYNEAIEKNKNLEFLRGKDAEAIKLYENLLNLYKETRIKDSITISNNQKEAAALYEKNIMASELRILQKNGRGADMIVVENDHTYSRNKITNIFIFFPSFIDPKYIYYYRVSLNGKEIERDEIDIYNNDAQLYIVPVMEDKNIQELKGKCEITIFYEKDGKEITLKTFSFNIK